MPLVVRKQKPPRLSDYREYKPYLWLDFQRRCAYCHFPAMRNGPKSNYTIDHFRPKSKFPKASCRYGNLYLSCRDCNDRKNRTWPSRTLIDGGHRFLDPCQDDFLNHWIVRPDGLLESKTAAGTFTISKLRLNRRDLVSWRREKSKWLEHRDDLVLLLREAVDLERPEQTIAMVRKLLANVKCQLSMEYGNFW